MMDLYPEDFATVTVAFTTHAADGSQVAPSSALEVADLKIYKNGSATEKTSTNGLTINSPFDSDAGVHLLVIDTSNDTGDVGFWAAGAVYDVLLAPDETVDGITVRKWVGKFGLGMAQRVSVIDANVVNASALATDAVTEIQSGLATSAALATVDTVVDAIQAKTDNLPSDPADASVIAGRFDTLDTSVADLPTNAELATALGTADDAVLAQIALVKAKTDGLTFTVAGVLDANIQYVNDVEVTGNGQAGTEWGP